MGAIPEDIYMVDDLQNALRYINVCSTSMGTLNNSAKGGKLESVSVYQTIDLLCEGEIAGLCDRHGNLVYLHKDSRKNTNGFKGIYLNDVPIKNTDASTLNYNRVFADFKVGTERQTPLAKFTNPALSFSNAVQTLNINTSLPGLAGLQQMLHGGSKFYVVGNNGERENLALRWNRKLGGDSFNMGAISGNFCNQVVDLSALTFVRAAERSNTVAVSHVITNDNANWAQVDMTVGALLYNHSDGNQSAAGVNFIIKTGYVDDELTLAEGGSVIYLICGIYGRCSSQYTRSHNVPLPTGGPQKKDRFIKVFRTDNELAPNNVKFQKSLSVGTISEIVEENFNYPHSALMGMIFDARAFSNPPTRRFDCKLTKVSIPSNYNPEIKYYRGNWDGQFKLKKEWTDNPAWIFYDLAVNERYGVGKFGFKEQFVDKWNLYSIGKYCDEFVPTGHTGKYADMDFTCTTGSITITIDDSSDTLGGNALLERYPEGGTVCLFSTKNSDSEDLDKAYKRLIFNPSYDNSTQKFTFTIVQIPDAQEVFQNYPAVKVAFLNQAGTLIGDAFVKEYLIKNQDSSSAFVSTYLGGDPLDLTTVSGKATTQFEQYRPLLESRFRCNLYLDKKQNAFNALNDIAALFRGMIYWSSGYITASNDQSREAVMLFTNANVQNGDFAYSGSSLISRTTAVTVRFSDEYDSYKPKVEYLEDSAGMREYGYNEKEIVALGVTSRGQAHRLAKWMLYTVQTETDTIQFTSGQEASYLKPGDVVKVQDKLKTSKRYGGRVVDIDYGAKTLTLDHGIEEDISGQTITSIVPKANKTVRELDKSAESKLKIAVEEQSPSLGVPVSDINASREPQIKEFTIDSVSETNMVTVTTASEEDFNMVLKGYIWSVQNTNSDYEIEEVEYRIIGVTEQNFNQYQVTGMMYNRSKFAAIDESRSVENTQQSKSTVVSIGSLPPALTGDSSGATDPIITFTNIQNDTILPYFDGKFPNISSYATNYYMTVDFSQLATYNAVNFQNTGGYILEIFKASGEKIRFSLAGHDNTRANILIGPDYERDNISVEIYRYDTSFKVNVGL